MYGARAAWLPSSWSARVAINGLLDDQQAPFGGFKNSGVGREFGTYGIEAFLEPRAILEA
jgi:aldehyde dehydrogenase (NAD+)